MEGFVRFAAALREIGSVIVETCQLVKSERMRVCAYSIDPARRVKLGWTRSTAVSPVPEVSSVVHRLSSGQRIVASMHPALNRSLGGPGVSCDRPDLDLSKFCGKVPQRRWCFDDVEAAN